MRSKRVAIVGGCGHAGLPLGIALASRGFCVALIDQDQRAVNRVNSGRLCLMDEGAETVLSRVVGKTLRATNHPDPIADAETVVFTAPSTRQDSKSFSRTGAGHTSVQASPSQPSGFSSDHCLSAIEQVLPFLKDNQLVLLRGTQSPGMTEVIWKFLQKRKPNLLLAYCPERVSQGHAVEDIFAIPQIVAAFDPVSEHRAASLFQNIAPETLCLTPQEAEFVKLFSNTWRYIDFAIANQHYMIAEGSGANFQRIFQALTHHYPRLQNVARAGLAAGPCLFQDAMELSSQYPQSYSLGHAAVLINEGLPGFLVQQLEKKMGPLEGKKIGLLGMAFKANHNDTRDSLSYRVKEILQVKMATILDTDVYQPSHEQLPWILRAAEGFILGVPHKEYKELDLRGKPYVDCWGAWEPENDLTLSCFEAERLQNVG